MQLIPYRDVLLVKKAGGIWGHLIRLFLRDRYGYIHSELVVDDWLTVGTDIRRPVGVHPFGYNLKEIDIYRYRDELTARQTAAFIESIQKLTKRKYDIWEAVFLGLNIKNYGKPGNYICITLITKAMEDAGMLPKGIHTRYKGFEVFTESGYFVKAGGEKNKGKNFS